VTERLSRRLLALGWRRLWLFTVASSPIADHLYAKLGFAHIEDFALGRVSG